MCCKQRLLSNIVQHFLSFRKRGFLSCRVPTTHSACTSWHYANIDAIWCIYNNSYGFRLQSLRKSQFELCNRERLLFCFLFHIHKLKYWAEIHQKGSQDSPRPASFNRKAYRGEDLAFSKKPAPACGEDRKHI